MSYLSYKCIEDWGYLIAVFYHENKPPFLIFPSDVREFNTVHGCLRYGLNGIHLVWKFLIKIEAP